MARGKAKDLSGLEATLDYSFRDVALLKRALTHASARNRNPKSHDYERLEFLGDRVLGLAIAELLFEQFPDAPEGVMARHLNRLVRKETCAVVAAEMKLGAYILMSVSEVDSGGRNKQKILGDSCEAVLGAILLDGGYDVARNVIHKFWSKHLENHSGPLRDAKSALQEWAQGKGLPIPDYQELGRKGPDHDPYFTTRVTVKNHEPAEGDGPNKRAAEQAAAAQLLQRLGLWNNDAR